MRSVTRRVLQHLLSEDEPRRRKVSMRSVTRRVLQPAVGSNITVVSGAVSMRSVTRRVLQRPQGAAARHAPAFQCAP